MAAANGLAMAFDYGTRRIGVAVGQRQTGTASAVGVIACRANQPDWMALERLLKDYAPQTLVVGLPLSLDGHEQPMTTAARGFARALERRFALPVELHDERLTSIEAGGRFAAQRAAGLKRRRDAATLDAMAAQVLLESWLTQPAPKDHRHEPA